MYDYKWRRINANIIYFIIFSATKIMHYQIRMNKEASKTEASSNNFIKPEFK
jgi:hypothetical protein|tara:strand:- start:2168 stop:2323 length:156 start_codon:yes stop_codon:yes gene_type:complete